MNRVKKCMEVITATRATSLAAAAAAALSIVSCSAKVVTKNLDDGDGASTSGKGAGGAQNEPPAQAAVTIKVSPTPGQACQHTNGTISMPAAQNAGVYGELLGCDLSTNCKPDQFVVVDRDRGTNVDCTVSPNGDNFNVSLFLVVEGFPSMSFQADGALSRTGGMLSINETNSVAQGGGSDPSCTVSIQPNRGVVARGKIWAQFKCTAFRDPSDLNDTGCTVDGAFLFENCRS